MRILLTSFLIVVNIALSSPFRALFSHEQVKMEKIMMDDAQFFTLFYLQSDSNKK